ncbi:Rpp20 subunit of nuclear RNase MRP and P-domain-containing protein [Durotheca rogersii]|uniref:Rpp20 subunit of nuclear RNase MRP and P-domain-containing protein n=1 Tax=Durotheca rogersii TaxID=419775 RepID=UPI00221F3ACF|nr:Rpp20 subunit of nuclear RNase MRP and P-domain-containing protein [Durotheca rogersii]KAI5867509.1 Rpp20 subunit of nuclear RNase MRP and P-domain-containing protein [Durotheca rogersii]
MDIDSAPDAPAARESQAAAKLTKLPPIPKGATVRRRPTPVKTPSTRSTRRIYVTANTPFRSVTARVRKQLDKNLRTASASSGSAFTSRLAGRKHASLDERVQAIQRHQKQRQRQRSDDDDDSATGTGSGIGIGLEDAGEVVVVGTGRAIQRVAEAALFFQKQDDCVVRLRTASVAAVNDVIEEDDEEWGGEGEERTRMMSSLEASIRLR